MFKALPDHMKTKGKSTNVQSHLSEKAGDNNLVSQPRVINVMQNAKLPVFPPGVGGGEGGCTGFPKAHRC